MRFGGVPMSVAMPPTEAEYAIPRKRAFANGATAAVSPVNSSILVIMARAFGTIVRAVAVLEIHMERKAVTMIIPKSKILGFNPNIKTVLRAILE